MDEPAKIYALLVMKLLLYHRVLGQNVVRIFIHFWGDQQLYVFHRGSRAKQVFNYVDSAVL